MKLFLTVVLCGITALCQKIPLDTFPMSAAQTPDGQYVLVLHSGSQKPSVQVLDAKTLTKKGRVELPDAWLGIAISPNGKNVYVSGGASASIFEFSLSAQGELQTGRTFETVPAAQRQPQDLIGDVQLSPDGRLIYAASLYRNQILIINPASGMVIERIPTTRRPYRILFHPDGKSFFVSGWADAAVIRHRTETGDRLGVIRTGPHPTDMVLQTRPPRLEEGEIIEWKSRLFVAAANTNRVDVFGFKEDMTSIPLGSINVALTPLQPAGMTPSALTLNKDQTTLYTVCSDGNLIAASDITGSSPLTLGYLPTEKYPTAATLLQDGRLFFLNGESNSATAIVPELQDRETAAASSTYRDQQLALPAQKSALQHVVYIIEDRATNGRNAQKLGQEFTRFSQFQMNGSTVPDRVEWASAAITNDFVRKLSPGVVAGRRAQLEEKTPVGMPPAGRLWDNARTKGLTVQQLNQAADAPEKLPQLSFMFLHNGDAELGKLVQKISRTDAWKSTVIFYVNAAEGSALLISPYTRGRGNDDGAYDTSSVLRTIELILGLYPMTQFDAAALPMTGSFGSTADVTAYQTVE